MRTRITQLSRLLLAGATIVGAMQAYAAKPVFSSMSLDAYGKITGNVSDADSPWMPLRITVTVDGNSTSSRTIFDKDSFSFQLSADHLNGASHQVTLLAENANSQTSTQHTTYTFTQTLSLPSNALPTLTGAALSSTGRVTGTVTDANVASGKTTVTLTVDGVLANRQEVDLGTAFDLQLPLPYLNGSSHSVVVKAEDANIPGLYSSQTLSGTVSAPSNTLPNVSFEVRSNGRIYGTATDPDLPSAPLNVLLFVDGGTEPVGIVGLATPQFEMAVPGAYFGSRTITLKVEDANIPLAFKTQVDPRAPTVITEQFNDRQKAAVDAAIDNTGLVSGTLYDVDNPLAYLRVRQYLASHPIGAVLPPFTAANEGAVMIEDVYTLEPVRRAFRTAAEQDLYGNRVPRKFSTQIPLTGTSRNFSTGSYNVYLFGNNDNEILQDGVEVIGYPISMQRSMMVNDIAVLRAGDMFSLQKTLARLNPGSSDESVRAASLFGQLWNNEIPVASGGTCETSIDGGAPNACRPDREGTLVAEPGAIGKFVPVALVNRFDLIKNPAGIGPENCGQYRIVYGREDSATRRSFTIFEAVVSNPFPEIETYGQAGCLAIQQMWENQRRIADPMERARVLEAFFYQGMSVTVNGITRAVPPVISRAHFMEDGSFDSIVATNGQIRTNEFLNPASEAIPTQPWVLKEFKLTTDAVVQRRVGENPVAALLQTSNNAQLALDFRAAFKDGSTNLGCLMSENINAFNFNLVDPNRFNNGQSFSSGTPSNPGLPNENDFLEHGSVGDSGSFVTELTTAMQDIRNAGTSCTTNSNQFKCQITPQQVLNRATARTCAGCHQPRQQNPTSTEFDLTAADAIGPGQSWPLSVTNNGLNIPTFVHVSTSIDDNAKRFRISQALDRQFLPARGKLMYDYVDGNGETAPALFTACDPDMDAGTPH